MIRNDGLDAGGSWDLLAKEGADKFKVEFQDWVSQNNFISHMMVLAEKG